MNNTAIITRAGIYFLLSTIITWYFIRCGSGLYVFNQNKMLLSCGIAGGKWALQILGALLFLKEKKWLFIRHIGFTCYVGSLVLVPYCFGFIRAMFPPELFLYSLIAAVLTMIVLYYRSVRLSAVSINWFLFWLLCLASAISLQLTVVFHIL